MRSMEPNRSRVPPKSCSMHQMNGLPKYELVRLQIGTSVRRVAEISVGAREGRSEIRAFHVLSEYKSRMIMLLFDTPLRYAAMRSAHTQANASDSQSQH